MTTYEETAKRFSLNFGREKVTRLEKYESFLAPNKVTHMKALKALKIKNTEMAYLSESFDFIEKASGFLSGTICITKVITYEQASKAPDILANSIEDLIGFLKDGLVGYIGETVLFPDSKYRKVMFNVELKVDDYFVPLYILGRYFGYSLYMSQLHPYSTAIYLNKKPGRSFTGKFNETFIRIYTSAVKRLEEFYKIDIICSVPAKPDKLNRFDKVLKELAEEFELFNVGDKFICIESYPDQKYYTATQREKNIKGKFKYNGLLKGKTVLLIDDIITTGSTIRECIRELKSKGAVEVIVLVLAINQINTGSYWSNEIPQVSCPECRSKMKLMVNYKCDFFYNCLNCHWNNKNTTLNFFQGWKKMHAKENSKFE